jgi:membrane-bound inhibitor of C-type lysozyme
MSPITRVQSVPPLTLVLLLAACNTGPSKEEQEEAAKNTFACTMNNERLVVRFASGEARLLMASGDRVTLYQIPSTTGARFSNGTLELRGKGAELIMIENGAQVALTGCAPYVPPPEKK